MSRFDQIYRKFILPNFFTKGWGNPENLKRILRFRKLISNRETCSKLIPKDYPVHIDKVEVHRGVRILEGHFMSPFTKVLPGIMPKEVETARFQVILPEKWKTRLKPVCLHLAGTGDHKFYRRRLFMARPLLKEADIASVILENPYYGVRKPKNQIRSSLQNVSDLFVMGGALVLESIVLFNWCESQGLGPLGITGISMGGHMACLAATNWHKPLALVPCLSGSTASGVFTQGVMSGSIPWEVLQSQYYGDSVYAEDIKNLIQFCDKDAYSLGKDFVKNYPDFQDEMQDILATDACRNSYIVGENVTVTSPRVNSSQDEVDRQSKESFTFLDSKSEESQNTSDEKVKKTFSSVLTQENVLHKFSPIDFKKLIKFKHKTSRPETKVPQTLDQNVLSFMKGVMDECTYLGNFSIPVDTSLIIIVTAKHDAYIPRAGVPTLDELWPGAEARYIDSGHVAAYLLQQDLFRQSIIEAFDRLTTKYYN